ncbi:predicted pyridoxal phosphate-dependent enzyme [Bellilinea caldifistulae]|uniref:DegT/DnrJ/EryC1/StrS aminotransferase n=1 Tax=Bellilinea caldifistulae TaxID=360411 RepID=A0A0P6X525_9CHLR|nr:DegT/DnrJ/EryC1/StrS aminotransferase family protein [Bellilinea caldifistulae]KPL74494.1 DegT/DnrJ/EryC1/StrS aminotransferase [Bellilinea caldifistulae]GAP11696.1 predicted pyridoxal phosphate-dependent enzyme [Bellilinea caldifistulae]
MNWKVPLADLDIGTDEILAVQKVLESRWLTMGSVTQQFEQEFAKKIGARHAFAVTNGTAALHLACLALGLGPGDEVIVPSLTFVASANAIRYTGATPVFAEIVSPKDLNISPVAVEKRINPRTRAIMVVHYGGYACDMTAIQTIAERHNLKIIEDAAHAVGGELEGTALGCWGEIGCFSFFSNKNMTTGEGGMVVTNDDELADRLRLLRSHGMTTLTWDRHQGRAIDYDVVMLGYNYRLDEIRSAIGLVQLNKLEKNNEQRRKLTRHYHSMLKKTLPQVETPFENYRGKTSAHLLPILLPQAANRRKIIEFLKSRGIQTSIHYPPVHQFSIYQPDTRPNNPALPITEEVGQRELTLPLYPAMTGEDVALVVNTLGEALEAFK